MTNARWYRRSTMLLLFLLLAGLLPAQPRAHAQTIQDSFVRRAGTRLTRNGQPFRFGGPNIYWLGLDENVGGVDYPTRFRMDNALDTVVAMGGTVVRAHTLGVSVGCPRCLMPQRGQWNNDAWRTIDYAVYAAKQRNLKLIIPLTDEYDYFHGGRTTWTRWRGVDDGQFWTNPDVIRAFMAYAGTIVLHTNQFTGLRLRDDPTILAWETGNELNAPSAWTATFARYLKRIDPNHLVMDGNYGLNPNSLAIPEIDIVSNHSYPMNPDTVRQDAARAQAAGKAFVVGEYGWNSGDLSTFLTAIEQSGAAGDAFWSLFGRDDNGNYVQHQDGYTLHYGTSNGTMQQAVRQLRTHAYAMREQTEPGGALPTVVERPALSSSSWPAVVWSGSDPMPPVWTPDGTFSNTVPAPHIPSGTFVAGVNMSGDAVTLHGQRWWSMAEAQANGMQLTNAVADRKSLTPQPSADRTTSTMLNSLVYAPKDNLGVALPLVNGTYQVYVWTMENYASNVRSWNLQLEGQLAARELGLLPLHTWTNYGPYPATVQDGVLNLDLVRASGGPMLSGFAVYRTGATAPTATSTPTSVLPSAQPTMVLPSAQPTTAPTTQPTGQPTSAPTPPATSTNLLRNGDFEAGTPSGWETQESVRVSRADAQRGSFGLALDGRGRIDQRFATTPGQTYDVMGYVRIAEQSQAPSWGGLRVHIVDGSWQALAASPPVTLANARQDQWVRVDTRFVARSAESRLIFQNFSNGQFRASADTFIVTANPVPSDGTGTLPSTPPTTLPTSQPTPLAPGVPTSTVVRVETRANDRNARDDWLKPWLRLTNIGTTPLPLAELSVRYWYTNETGGEEAYVCDDTPIGCANVRGRVVRLNPAQSQADSYLELSFSNNAGRLAPGQGTGDVQHRLNHRSWQSYNEANDYSYPTGADWSDSTRVTVYRNGVLIAGQEPDSMSPPTPP